MTSNNYPASPFDALLRQYIYGEISIRTSHLVFCEGDTCREWRPIDSRVFEARQGESWESFDRRYNMLVELEDESRSCQGHLVEHDMIRGMLRSFSYKPASDDRERDGNLCLSVLPWDDKTERLTARRAFRTRVFNWDFRTSGFYLVNGDGSTAIDVSLRQWQISV